MAVMIHHHEAIVAAEAPVAEHNEYPKHMIHPGFQPATIGTRVEAPGGAYYTGGKPVRFAPVLVNSADDEEYYAAKGYVSQGKSDPAAFARAVQSAAPAVTGYVPQKYPMWAGGKLVNNEEEEAAALAERREQLGIVSEPQAEPATVEQETAEHAEDVQKTADQMELETLRSRHEDLLAERQKETEEFRKMKAQFAEMQAMMAKLTAASADVPEPSKEMEDYAASRQAAPAAPIATAEPATMTKGQKAWATRQKRLAERVAQQQAEGVKQDAA